MESDTKLILIEVLLAAVLFLSVSSMAFGQSPQSIHYPNLWGRDDSPSIPLIPCSNRYEAMSQLEAKAALGDSNVTLIGHWAWGNCYAVNSERDY